MYNGVGVHGTWFEVLADDEGSLAVRVSGGKDFHVSCDDDIAGDFSPDEEEVITPSPHVVAAAGDPLCLFRLVIVHVALMRGRADIGRAFEDPRAISTTSGGLRDG